MRTSIVPTATACLLALAGLGGYAAAANAKPVLGLTLPQVDAGVAATFSYTATQVPRTASVVLQRKMGTSGVFHTVVKLPRATKGTGRLPALGLGQYTLRLAVLAKHNAVLSSRVGLLRVFGVVPFSTLFAHVGYKPLGDPVVTSTRTFPWVWVGNESSDPQTRGIAVSLAQTDGYCRSVHLEFVPVPGGPRMDGETFTATVLQQSADPVAASVPEDTIGTLDVQLKIGDSWAVNLSHAGGGYSATYFFNGFGSCEFATPFS